MAVLEHLQPKEVFAFFEEICAIPHGSGNTKAISDYLAAFARERGLECHQDEWNNITIVKPAAPGYETAPTLILQGHMDMVCDAAPGCGKDMSTQGLDLAVDGDLLYARDTSLGGDDGIAVAMAMAILDSKTLKHPRLEVVITVDEEIGMLGAAAMDVSHLQGRMMINLDSDTEDTLFVGCAGGNMSHMILPVTRAPYAGKTVEITVSGLLGGHSGVEIHLGRANANMLLGRVLRGLQKQMDLRIVRISGGARENAIPSSACAVVCVEDETALGCLCSAWEEVFRREFATTDPGVSICVNAAPDELPMDKASTDRAVCLLTCAPNGVQVMSPDMEGLVQTSLNLGTLSCTGDSITAGFCLRSSVDSQTGMMVDQLEVLAGQLGGRLEVTGSYPGWAFRPDSPLRQKMAQVYTRQYGHPPKILAVHAGAECGMFVGKIPGLDCLCFGPNMTGLHSYHERLDIASVQRVWKVLVEVLRQFHSDAG